MAKKLRNGPLIGVGCCCSTRSTGTDKGLWTKWMTVATKLQSLHNWYGCSSWSL